jgi:hypothetical protein
MVMNSDPKDDNQRQREVLERRLLFQPEPEEIAIGIPSDTLAPKVVHIETANSNVNY